MRGAAADTATLDIFGVIGDYGLRAEDFKRALDSITARLIVVNINSPGGDVFAGVAAYNLLVDHPAEVHIVVHGLAASAASLITMAGDKVIMGDGSFLMIHNAWTLAVGDTREMAKVSRVLAQIDKEMAGIYAARADMDAAEVKTLMDVETWFSASDAIEAGFADETAKDAGADKAAAARFDLTAYRNVPKALLKVKGSKRSAKASTPAALPTPRGPDLSPLKAELARLLSSMSN